jgi:hypothetical protein
MTRRPTSRARSVNAWHRALTHVRESAFMSGSVSLWIDCTGRGDPRAGGLETNRFSRDGKCLVSHVELEDDLDPPIKLATVVNAKDKGWTWNQVGNWLCPECSKEGKR